MLRLRPPLSTSANPAFMFFIFIGIAKHILVIKIGDYGLTKAISTVLNFISLIFNILYLIKLNFK